MDAWNKGTHGKSGLIDKVKASAPPLRRQAQDQLSDHIFEAVCAGQWFAHVWQLDRSGPTLSGQVHAQAGGIFPLPQSGCQHAQGAVQALAPEVYASFKKQQRHTALADVHESIDELEHYRRHFLKLE
jgi:oligoribonuclease